MTEKMFACTLLSDSKTWSLLGMSVVSLEVSSSVDDPSHVKKDHDYVHFHWQTVCMASLYELQLQFVHIESIWTLTG